MDVSGAQRFHHRRIAVVEENALLAVQRGNRAHVFGTQLEIKHVEVFGHAPGPHTASNMRAPAATVARSPYDELTDEPTHTCTVGVPATARTGTTLPGDDGVATNERFEIDHLVHIVRCAGIGVERRAARRGMDDADSRSARASVDRARQHTDPKSLATAAVIKSSICAA